MNARSAWRTTFGSHRRSSRDASRPLFLLALALLNGGRPDWLPAATLSIAAVDNAGDRLPCRVHLLDAAGNAQHPTGLPFFRDHFVCPGFAELSVEPGRYKYEIERGPEYAPATGIVEVLPDQRSTIAVSLQRIVNMAERGWWSGELHVHRNLQEAPLHLRAEDLHVAPVITWWNQTNDWRGQSLPSETLVKVDQDRYYDIMAGEDEREGGALLYFGLKQPLPLPGDRQDFPEHPSPLTFIAMAREQEGGWIDIEKPFWWDTPIWLASGQINSIGVANNHMCRSSMLETEAWGKPRDEQRLPPPLGNGYWTQEIYYHILNSGFRVPPSAGSASGVLPNPVGYNRAYVYLGSDFAYRAWWEGLRAGRSFVTNGPMLLCRANGQLPGHVFKSDAALTIELDIELIANDNVPAVEIIQNGRIARTVAVDRREDNSFDVALPFAESGWFVVRAIADNPQTFRFASTAPYYVEIGGTKSRISRSSVEFFLAWIDERAARVPHKLSDRQQLREVLAYHDQAKLYWRQILKRANAQ